MSTFINTVEQWRDKDSNMHDNKRNWHTCRRLAHERQELERSDPHMFKRVLSWFANGIVSWREYTHQSMF